MGTSRNSLELSRKFAALADEVEKRQAEASKQGAAVVARKVRSNVRAATGGDFVLSGTTRTTAKTRSGKPRKAARIDVFTAKARSVKDGSFVGMRGPAQLIENDVNKHYVVSRWATGAQNISAKTGRKIRATRQSRIATVAFGQKLTGGGRRAVLNFGGGNYKRWTVAYSKGRKPWERGVRSARGEAVRAMRNHEAKAVGAVFK